MMRSTGFGGFQGDFDGFAIAHFADENDFGRLTQGGAQREREGGCVGVQFALVNRGFLVAVEKFDGILDGEDVVSLLGIHFVEDGGERRRFAGTSRAGDQDDAGAQLDDFLQLQRKVQLFKGGDAFGNDAHHDGMAAALPEDVHAEAAHASEAVG
jgi:hypothetical protein